MIGGLAAVLAIEGGLVPPRARAAGAAPPRAAARGCASARTVSLRQPLVREAVLSAAAAGCGRRRARVARAARHRLRRARVPAHALPRARLHALEQLLVRGPLQLRHVQPPLLPARGAPRDPAARGRDDRARGARVRGRARGASGAPTTRWSSRTFAVVWAGIVLSAAFPFALGMAFALLAIWALQAGKRWRFAALAALTLAASPLAFLLLVVVLAGVALARRERCGQLGAGRGRRGRGARRGRALADLPRRRAVPVLGDGVRGGRRVLRLVPRDDLARRGAACCASSSRVVSRRDRRRCISCRRRSARTSRGCATRRSRSSCSSSRCGGGGRASLGVAVLVLAVAWNLSPLAWSYVQERRAT